MTIEQKIMELVEQYATACALKRYQDMAIIKDQIAAKLQALREEGYRAGKKYVNNYAQTDF